MHGSSHCLTNYQGDSSVIVLIVPLITRGLLMLVVLIVSLITRGNSCTSVFIFSLIMCIYIPQFDIFWFLQNFHHVKVDKDFFM